MTNLLELQDKVKNYLLHKDEEAVTSEIMTGGKIPVNKRLSIYGNAYRWRLYEILYDDFPKLHTLLGDDAFEKFTQQYLENYPSTFFSVRYFGSFISKFLKETHPYKNHGVLYEMAQFEWALSLANDSADAKLLEWETLTQMLPEQWPDLRFRFHPSVQKLIFHWDIPGLWLDIEAEKSLRDLQQRETPFTWLIWRKNLQSHFISCTSQQSMLVDNILTGKNFEAICEALKVDFKEDALATFLTETLRHWVSEGLIV